MEIIAESVKDVVITSQESKDKLNGFKQKHNLDDALAFDEYLRSNALNIEHLQWQLELDLRIQRYSLSKFKHKAEARFLQTKEQRDVVVYSLLRLKDVYLARELYLRIKGGEANFADLSQKYSEGKEANTKGIIGPVPLTKAHPILAERLRISSPGELIEPFKINEWILIARLEKYEPAKLDEQTRQQLTRELFYDWISTQVSCKIKGLKL